MKAVVIIPTYNEIENIHGLVPAILAQDRSLEILVVDDNSPDGTGDAVDKLCQTEPRLHVLHRTTKDGLGRAYIAGFKWALDYGADLVLEMDADHSHNPDYLPALLQASKEADVVLGSRYTEGGGTVNWPWWRQLMSRGGSLYARTVLGYRIKDLTGGFKCFRRSVLEEIDFNEIQAAGYGFQVELTHLALKAGFKVVEVPITFVDRRFGESKMDKAIFWEAARVVLQLRFGQRRKRKTANRPHPVVPEGSMRILQVIAEVPPIKSGVAKVAAELQAGLEAKGHHVDTLSSSDIPRVHIGEYRFSAFVFKWSQLRDNLADYDLINIHAPAPTFTDLFLLFASRFGTSQYKGRLILTYHSEIDLPGVLIKPLSRLYSWLHKKISFMAGHTIVTSPSYAEMFDHMNPADITIIPWGVTEAAVDLPPIEKPNGPLQIAFVGQLRPYKGLDILLKALVPLPNAQLKVIGEGHQAESYHQLAQELGLNNVEFLGAVDDETLYNTLKECHTLVLPSLTMADAFGIVLLEAMSVGCVPIASKLPGVQDVIGEVGLTFPIGEINTLTEQLTYLRDNPRRRQRYAHQARLRAKQYTWGRTIDAHEQLFRRIAVVEEVKSAGEQGQSLIYTISHVLAHHLNAQVATLPPSALTDHQYKMLSEKPRGTIHFPTGISDNAVDGSSHFSETHSTLITTLFRTQPEPHLICFTRTAEHTPFTNTDRQWLEETVLALISDIEGLNA